MKDFQLRQTISITVLFLTLSVFSLATPASAQNSSPTANSTVEPTSTTSNADSGYAEHRDDFNWGWLGLLGLAGLAGLAGRKYNPNTVHRYRDPAETTTDGIVTNRAVLSHL